MFLHAKKYKYYKCCNIISNSQDLIMAICFSQLTSSQVITLATSYGKNDRHLCNKTFSVIKSRIPEAKLYKYVKNCRFYRKLGWSSCTGSDRLESVSGFLFTKFKLIFGFRGLGSEFLWAFVEGVAIQSFKKSFSEAKV